MNNDLLKRTMRMASAFLALGLLIACLHSTAGSQTQAKPRTQLAKVVIGEYGYDPVSVRLRKGIPAKVTFLRIAASTCATEVVLPDYGIRRDLPLNQKVTVSFTPKKAGEFAFTCGMNMHRGKLLVQ